MPSFSQLRKRTGRLDAGTYRGGTVTVSDRTHSRILAADATGLKRHNRGEWMGKKNHYIPPYVLSGMSELIAQETPIKIAWTANVTPCKNGGYAGVIREVSLVAQADTMDKLRSRLEEGLAEYIKYESLDAMPRTMIRM